MAQENENRDDQITGQKSGSKFTKVYSNVTWTEYPTRIEEKDLDVTPLLQKKCAAIRSQEAVNWLPYLEAKLISDRDYSFITSFQSTKTKKERDVLLHNFKDEGFKAMLSVVKNVCVVEEIQKFLVIVDDMLFEDKSRIQSFNPEETEPWTPFLGLLSCADEFVCYISSRIICKFLWEDICNPESPDLYLYFNWLKGGLREDNKYLLAAARCLQRLLRIDSYRELFFKMNGIFRITRVLCCVHKPQEQYQLVFCLWVSSFNIEIAEQMNGFSAMPIMVDILDRAPTEVIKLPRVVMATIRNLLTKPREEAVRRHNALLLIQCRMFRSLQILKNRDKTLSDPELNEDCEVVEEVLKKYVDELSTFDEYQMEVRSNRLEWSVVHTSEPFWEECAHRLNDNEYELLKILVSLLEACEDTVVLCVAAHDIGAYMRHYMRGKNVVESLGGKSALLRLLGHQHPGVKYHVLKTLQIMMLNNFQLLSEYISNTRTMDQFKINSS